VGVRKTGLIDWINYSASQSRLNGTQGDGVQYYLGVLYIYVEDYGLAAVYTILTFLTRLVILTLTIPLFLMAASTGWLMGWCVVICAGLGLGVSRGSFTIGQRS
jgi:hypothetical protein